MNKFGSAGGGQIVNHRLKASSKGTNVQRRRKKGDDDGRASKERRGALKSFCFVFEPN